MKVTLKPEATVVILEKKCIISQGNPKKSLKSAAWHFRTQFELNKKIKGSVNMENENLEEKKAQEKNTKSGSSKKLDWKKAEVVENGNGTKTLRFLVIPKDKVPEEFRKCYMRTDSEGNIWAIRSGGLSDVEKAKRKAVRDSKVEEKRNKLKEMNIKIRDFAYGTVPKLRKACDKLRTPEAAQKYQDALDKLEVMRADRDEFKSKRAY